MVRRKIVTLLCMMTVLASSMTVQAATQQAEVLYEKASSYNVTISKVIVLNEDKTAEYSVAVNGDLTEDASVTVSPESSIAMKDTRGKADVIAKVNQPKTVFAAKEVNTKGGATTKGTVSSNDLSAGSWSGALNFNIKLNEKGRDGL